MSRFRGIHLEYGMVLIAMLLLLQVSCMLALYFLQASLLSQKISMSYGQHDQLFFTSVDILQHIENHSISEYAFCRIDKINRQDLLSKSHDWWETFGCKQYFNELKYYYVIETLKNNTCIKSKDDIDISMPVIYFRISLLVYSKNKVIREFLQSTMIKLDNAKRDCVDEYSDVILGRQSWRRL